MSRIEDASLNASAPPQQRWLDGWLLRYSPGKAKRARSINAVAAGRMPLADKLRLCEPVYRQAGLPMVLRITRFSQPAGLDGQLAALGFGLQDDTRVLVKALAAADALPGLPDGLPGLPDTLPGLTDGLEWVALGAQAFAEAVGTMRGSPLEQRRAHAQRLALSPVPYCGFAVRRQDDGAVLACGQFAAEAELAGVYDVLTDETARGRGLATTLCQRLLSLAASAGARVAYLQVDAHNHAAMRIYQRLGFAEGYSYHYRHAPDP